jgi:NDP-sugar pyrophosphorylase family protein
MIDVITMKVVILAGGKGRRLLPYTMVFPKPLVPIDDKPILEIILNQLKQFGMDDIIMAVGHLHELINTYFGDGSKFGVSIEYSVEAEPLGTAGPLRLFADKLDETFILMNGDILTDLDLNDLISYHKQHGAVATISMTNRQVEHNYGIVESDPDNNLTGWREKPRLDFNVSMGIYVLEPEALEYIPEGQAFDLPDLIVELIKAGKTVKGYTYEGYWLVIGLPKDYEQALAEYKDLNVFKS